MTQNITEIIGSLATLTLLLGYLPQTIHTIRTRKTDDIALGTFLRNPARQLADCDCKRYHGGTERDYLRYQDV